MLKALQRPVVSAQQNTKIRRATTQTRLFLIWLTSLMMIEKGSNRRLKKEIFIIVKNIILTKNWFVVSNFWGFPKYYTGKKCAGHLYFLQSYIHYFQNFLVTEYLREVNQTHFSYRNYFRIFVLRWSIIKLIKNPFIIKLGNN